MKQIFLMLLPLLLLISFSCNDDDIEPNNIDLFETIQLVNEDKTDITDISFYDDINGVICGSLGFFAKTVDGGKTWNKLNVGVNHSFMSTFMLDINILYTARYALYQTNNSGISFNEIGKLTPKASSIFDIYFNNNSIGFIAHETIKKTTDGGNTWVEKYSTNHYYCIKNLKFTSESIGYGCGGAQFDYFNGGQIVKTTNGGETWSEILTTIQITSISFIDSNVGFYSNVDGEIFKTKDGGLSWNKISTLDFYPTDILFRNNDVGYLATYEGKMLISIDGGNTWKVAYEKTTVPINKIIKTSNHIFAVGNNGLILKSK